ncbi:hypothetical protein [Sandaracinobacteroides saxicola]|uniref:Uncharacterized protein n=1 Tax=Sandaracinobacteroides saxicola TaxID=2759707 RepID=A0A7G5IDW5_9SPHN|nr:hypothetical protein [Sandaracinobacteroides saxicola]QMW21557.1 hypothetical protein H3309_08975 [Sandaracinobacteroides saxicola]
MGGGNQLSEAFYRSGNGETYSSRLSRAGRQFGAEFMFAIVVHRLREALAVVFSGMLRP